MQGKGEDIAAVVRGVLAETKKLLLLGLSVPLDDAAVLRAGVDVLRGQFKPSDAQSVTFVLDSLTKLGLLHLIS